MNKAANIPHIVLLELLYTLDDIRRESLKLTSSSHIKKLMGLTIRQASAIARLKMLMTKAPQGVALKTLAQELQMTVPATSLLVETMVGKGVFERNQNPDDRRAICIRLSAKGQELFDVGFSALERQLDNHSAEITKDELEICRRVSEKLSRSISRGKSY
jgi:DNA-binding MarR family transcriptional regulator